MLALCCAAAAAMAYETNSTLHRHTHNRALTPPSAHTLFRTTYAFWRVVRVCVCCAVNDIYINVEKKQRRRKWQRKWFTAVGLWNRNRTSVQKFHGDGVCAHFAHFLFAYFVRAFV